MPTLFRFVMIIGVTAAVIYGAMLALAFLVTPNRVEMSVPVHIDDQPPTNSP